MTRPSPSVGSSAESWSSSLGFVLAAIGSAVGLGNVWRFAYVAGENGGGAFVLVYLAAVVLVALPILIAEIALGRWGHGSPPTRRARAVPPSTNPVPEPFSCPTRPKTSARPWIESSAVL